MDGNYFCLGINRVHYLFISGSPGDDKKQSAGNIIRLDGVCHSCNSDSYICHIFGNVGVTLILSQVDRVSIKENFRLECGGDVF